MPQAIEWTEAASRDLEGVAEYIARDSAAYSTAFVERVIHAIESVVQWPESASTVPEFEDPAIRETFVNRYRMIFRVRDSGILVLAIVHGARHLPSFWDQTGHDPGNRPKDVSP